MAEIKTTAIQQKKINHLAERGGKVAGGSIKVVMPDGSMCSICPAGSVVWIYKRSSANAAIQSKESAGALDANF